MQVTMRRVIRVTEFESLSFTITLDREDVPAALAEESASKAMTQLHRAAYKRVLLFVYTHGVMTKEAVVEEMRRFDKSFNL